MASILTVYVLVCTLAVCTGNQVGCPKAEAISPCTCKHKAFVYVMCTNFKNSSLLINAMEALRGYKIDAVNLHGLQLEDTLPTHLFEGLQFNELSIKESTLRFTEPAFSGLEISLNKLNIMQNSKIQSDSKFTLAKLKNLYKFSVESNPLKEVKNNFLNKRIPSVQEVVLDHNDIAEVEYRAFASLTYLKTISISDNRIKNIQRSMFPQPALHLIKVDLSSNKISMLPKDMFKEMPSLREVVLSNNTLAQLPEATWTPVWGQLTVVLLSMNPLDCGEDMKWIQKYKKPDQLDGNCFLPTNMRGRPFKEVLTTRQ